MSDFVFYPFQPADADGYVNQCLTFFKNRGYSIIPNSGPMPIQGKIQSTDTLHILGHGNNFNGNVLDANLNAKPSIPCNTLAGRVRGIIDTSHKLIMLDCCFAMGQYFNRNWWAGKSGEFLGKLLALELGKDHQQIIIGGNVNAATSPQETFKNDPVGYDIGTKFTKNDVTSKAFAGKSVSFPNQQDSIIVPRLLYYVNNKGEWVSQDGSPASGPQKLG